MARNSSTVDFSLIGLAAAARPVVGGALPAYSLAIWHGFNAPLAMSLVALGAGLAGYLLYGQRLKSRPANGMVSLSSTCSRPAPVRRRT